MSTPPWRDSWTPPPGTFPGCPGNPPKPGSPGVLEVLRVPVRESGCPRPAERPENRESGCPLRVTGYGFVGHGLRAIPDTRILGRLDTRTSRDSTGYGLSGYGGSVYGSFRGCVKACVRIVDMHCVGIRGGRGRSRVGGWCRGRLLCVGGLSDIRVGCEPKKIRKPGFVTSTPFPPNPPSPEPPSSPFPYDFRRDRFQPLPLLFPGIP